GCGESDIQHLRALTHLCPLDLQEVTGLNVQQLGPRLLEVRLGSQVTLTCCVTQAQAVEGIRAEWSKDNDTLCHSRITHDHPKPKPEACGPRGQFSWQLPGVLSLRLEHVNLNDSGRYVCGVTVEIPLLEEAKGNGTELQVKTDGQLLDPNQISSSPGEPCAGIFRPDPNTGRPPTSPPSPGMQLALVAGCVVVILTAIALGAWIWRRRRRRRQLESATPLYCNILYQPRQAPKKAKACAAEGTMLDIPREAQKVESFYSTSFPEPSDPQQGRTPSPCPSPTEAPRIYSRYLP
ncbi:Transmembrane and immunoglobulin domain-containing protein 2, partial [Galemys pyrenaicus]